MADARDEDPDAGGELLPTAIWWFAVAGMILLLPRQWWAAGLAFAIAGALRVVAYLRARNTAS